MSAWRRLSAAGPSLLRKAGAEGRDLALIAADFRQQIIDAAIKRLGPVMGEFRRRSAAPTPSRARHAQDRSGDATTYRLLILTGVARASTLSPGSHEEASKMDAAAG